MLGPYSSGLTKAMAPVTEKYQVPMVEANGASRSLFTKGYKYLFAVLAPANLYLDVAIDLAVEKNGGKPVKIAMAFEQDAFSQDVRLGILDAAKRTGSKIIIDVKLPKELNDMAATLSKVKAVKPDVLVVSGHTKGALTAVRQIAEMKVEIEANNQEKTEQEFGDVLFSMINYARFLNIDPETALEKTNKKFKHRFELME